jgi:multiple sugar transport system ATP-binding protein
MTVAENIGFGLSLARRPKAEIAAKVAATAETLQLTQLLERKPKALSGGQRQRVAIGRAIIRDPKVFLFDEPLSNLDASLRAQMRLEIADLHARLKSTMIYVTHDQVEAMTMADKIVVLKGGAVEQIGSPMELYRNPATPFVAGFIGSPKMNFIDGPEAAKHQAHSIGVRPEHFTLSRSPKPGAWKGTVAVAELLGSDTFLHVNVDGFGLFTVRTGGEDTYKHGDEVYLTPEPTRIYKFGPDGKAL